MPATILDFTAGATTERGVKIQNSQIFRKIKDDTWTTLRVGVRWICEDDTGSNPTAGAQFAFGVCNGNTEGMGSSNRKHCLVVTNVGSGGTVNSITRAVSAADYFSLGFTPASQRFCKYINNVQTVSSSGIAGSAAPTRQIVSGIGSTFYSNILLFNITRASPNYLLRCFIFTGSTPTNTTRQVFLEQMEATTPSLSNYQWTTADQVFSVDEATDGVLDHFHFYWNRTAPSITLLDAAVCKIQ